MDFNNLTKPELEEILNKNKNNFLTIKEYAKSINKSASTIYHWIDLEKAKEKEGVKHDSFMKKVIQIEEWNLTLIDAREDLEEKARQRKMKIQSLLKELSEEEKKELKKKL